MEDNYMVCKIPNLQTFQMITQFSQQSKGFGVPVPSEIYLSFKHYHFEKSSS